MLSSIAGIFGPVFAGFMCNFKVLGRKYTMAIGAMITMALFFGYAAVKTPAQNVGLSCAISFSLNIYYGTCKSSCTCASLSPYSQNTPSVYAYTPEVLPSAHRATGNGIAVAFNRVMGLVSSFVAAYGNTSTSVPIFVCAALYIVMVSYTLWSKLWQSPADPKHFRPLWLSCFHLNLMGSSLCRRMMHQSHARTSATTTSSRGRASNSRATKLPKCVIYGFKQSSTRICCKLEAMPVNYFKVTNWSE